MKDLYRLKRNSDGLYRVGFSMFPGYNSVGTYYTLEDLKSLLKMYKYNKNMWNGDSLEVLKTEVGGIDNTILEEEFLNMEKELVKEELRKK